MSGMAPGAAVAMYKSLWSATMAGTTDSYGFTDDIILAFQQAVTDGVDVINYSIGGQRTATSVGDPMFEAFRGAALAGVVVAAAAGNAGAEGASTVLNEAPWVITVAAGTHPRALTGTVAVDGAGTFKGASVAPESVGPMPLYFAGSSNNDAALCFDGKLDAAAAGKIVVCLRGTNARVAKSAEVARVNGTGMLLLNVAGGATDLAADVSTRLGQPADALGLGGHGPSSALFRRQQPAGLPAGLLAARPAWLPACRPAGLAACLPACLPACLWRPQCPRSVLAHPPCFVRTPFQAPSLPIAPPPPPTPRLLACRPAPRLPPPVTLRPEHPPRR
jgi:hypothetical protein